MKIRANMHYKDKYTCDEEYIIERAVTISSAKFDYMCKHLLEDNIYIEDNLDAMFYDGNKLHCLLLINDATGDGLLINSEGSEYARYHSYIPNARQIVILNKYPVLNNFIERMSEVTEDILSKASAELSKDNDEYEVDIEKYNKPGEPVINAALLGLGTVGTGVYKVLKNQEEEMTAKIGCKVKIRKILVRNLEKAAGKVDDPAVLTNSWEDIKADPSIDIIIELIGGIEPARTYILDALHAGKHVVTANKDLIAVHGKELMDTARASHVDFLFEAAVAGGIPIIRPLKQCLAGNHMSEVMAL